MYLPAKFLLSLSLSQLLYLRTPLHLMVSGTRRASGEALRVTLYDLIGTDVHREEPGGKYTRVSQKVRTQANFTIYF